MKRVLLGTAWLAAAMAALTLAWPSAFAAPDDERPPRKGPPPGRDDDRPPPPPMHLERALEDLNLNKEQQARVEKIIRTHHEKMRKLMDKMRDDLLKDMKSVLTKEQYKDFQKAMQRRGPGGPGDGPPPPRGGKERPGKRPPPPDDRE